MVLFAGILCLGAGIHVGISYASSLLASTSSWNGTTSTTEPAAVAAPAIVPVVISTTTPQSVISKLTIADVVPATGPFIAADLASMELYLYQDGTTTAEYPILSKGAPGSPDETPTGVYSILSKETDHINSADGIEMPYAMQLYGNCYMHGWPTQQRAVPVASSYTGDCIRLSTANAATVYAFAEIGTKVFVYNAPATSTLPTLTLAGIPMPSISAPEYLVADVDTGDVYAEKNAEVERPIASITKLMTTLIANEAIPFDDKITLPRGQLSDPTDASDTAPETFKVGDLLYPLLMESNNNIADQLGIHYGTDAFVAQMNQEAEILDMASTTFVDPSGVSRDNVSTPDDLYRLAVYIADNKSFVWNITRTPEKTIDAENGSEYAFTSFNKFFNLSSFVGGKVGETAAAGDTMVSIFALPVGGETRRIAVIILDSDDDTTDTQKLTDWFEQSATEVNTACASCALPSLYPKIQL